VLTGRFLDISFFHTAVGRLGSQYVEEARTCQLAWGHRISVREAKKTTKGLYGTKRKPRRYPDRLAAKFALLVFLSPCGEMSTVPALPEERAGAGARSAPASVSAP
jgi:hypothetical protein